MGTMIVGVDPGLSRTGVVLTEKEGEIIKLVDYFLPTPKETDFIAKIDSLAWEINQYHLLKSPRGNHVYLAIEEPIYSWGRRNPKVFAKQNMLLGIILVGAYKSFGRVYMINPKVAKKTFTGMGKADKKKMVQEATLMSSTIKTIKNRKNREAISDACAIAFTLWSHLDSPIKGVQRHI